MHCSSYSIKPNRPKEEMIPLKLEPSCCEAKVLKVCHQYRSETQYET